jgi:lipopolysaccharide biosynthesis protein
MAERPRKVRRLTRDRVRVERGGLSIGNVERVVVVAQWSESPRLSRSVCTLVSELQANDYRVVVSSACEAPEPLEWDATVDVDRLTVLRKPNIGYDFGSWSVALQLVPEISSARRVLLVNDSMIGPFAPLAPLLTAFDTTAADVWGLTDTQQFGHHLQSYFFGFCNGVLTDRPLAAFWADIRHYDDKMQIILENEVALGRLLREEGYVAKSVFSHELFVQPGQNPVIVGWKGLLKSGFPFVKREILRHPSVAPAGATMPDVVKAQHGADVDSWVAELSASDGGSPSRGRQTTVRTGVGAP